MKGIHDIFSMINHFSVLPFSPPHNALIYGGCFLITEFTIINNLFNLSISNVTDEKEETICAYPIMCLIVDQYTGTLAFYYAKSGTDAQFPYIGLQ